MYLIVPFCSHIVSIGFCASSFTCLSLFKMTVLKSLSSRSAVRSFSLTVSVTLCLSPDKFHGKPCDFSVENWRFEPKNMATVKIRLYLLSRVCCFC